MKVFSGSSNPDLAKKIAKQLNCQLAEIELSQFANGERRVWVREKTVNHKAVVVQSFSSPPDEHIVEFCLIIDALHRQGVKKIIAVIPWMGYCIQDKVFRSGEPLSAKVVSNLIQSQKIDRIITLDLHNQVIEGFFDVPFTEHFATYTFVDYIKQKKLTIDTIISPDVGALKKSNLFAESFNLPLVVINKKRDKVTGKVSMAGVSGKVAGKKVLIVDDFISTGGTMCQTIAFLKRKKVKKIYACATHHFYIPGVQEKIEKTNIDRLFVTDSIQDPKNKKYRKLEIVSISRLISGTIKKYERI